ncbi:hypothetical protein ACH5RR_022169 [Cinchona calisaya]|uniref:TF-B3 domain-containing protein n=1 Tax=Cinchona calisaya TaxID=153742 RepID=A0ABD2ZAY3_9GENT
MDSNVEKIVKKEVDDQQEQLTSESDDEDQMTLDQFLISKVKQNIVPLEKYEKAVTVKRSKIKPKSPVSEIKKAILKRRGRRGGKRIKSTRDIKHLKVPSSILDRAEEVRANLDPRFPSFVKLMLPSHVTQGFWLGLPADFCKMHLPKHNEFVALEDENGEEYKTRFLAAKVGLSGGWKGFTIAHKLVEGDAVVYHLVGHCKFKVYIVRPTSLGEVDGALGLLDLKNHPSGRDSVKIAEAIKSCKISTSHDDFALWDKTLAGFELPGMEVGFLRTRLEKLVKLAIQLGELQESERYKQAMVSHNLEEEEIRSLEMKLLEKHQLGRLEQNKKKLDEFNITELSQALHTAISPKPSPMKKVKPRVPVDPSTVRRSCWVADKPRPSYKELLVEPLGSYNYSQGDLSDRVYVSDNDGEYAQEKAEELQSGLDHNFPSFVNRMLQSHVTGGLWLGLPVQFCKTYLPKCDKTVTLIDEQVAEYSTKYLAFKPGLSGGWRGFSIEHELVDGDALVFQLIEPTKFKAVAIFN